MANEHKKRCSLSLTTREMQMQSTRSYQLTPTRTATTSNNRQQQVCMRVWRDWDMCALLVGREISAAALDISKAFLEKL